MPLHLGSTLATLFVALFSSSLGIFASFRSRPRMPVMNGSWRISRTEGSRRGRGRGGERKKKRYSRPMRELFEDEGSWCSGVWKKKRQHEEVGETDGEGGLPTTSSFSYDWSNQLYPNYGGSSLMISIDGSNLDLLLTLSSISFREHFVYNRIFDHVRCISRLSRIRTRYFSLSKMILKR